MIIRKILVCVSILIMCSISTNTQAMSFLFPANDNGSGSVTQNTDSNDNLLGAGNEVNLNANVANDAFLFGNLVTINSNILGNLFAGGQLVNLTNSKIDHDLFIGASNISLDKNTIINASAYLGSNNQTIDGTIKGNLYSGANSLNINGVIEGDVHASVNQLTLGSNAVVKGKITYTSSNDAKISSGASYTAIEKIIPQSTSKNNQFKSTFGPRLLGLLSVLLLGVVILTLFSKKSLEIAQYIRQSFWSSLGWGLTILVLAPIACVFVMTTIIGIPLALTILTLYILLISISKIFAGLALGQLITKNRWLPIWSLTVGILAISIISSIPFLGGLTNFVVMLVGIGGFFLLIKQLFAKK